MRVITPRYFETKTQRHLVMSKDYMIRMGVDDVLDVLIDHGFTTKLELTRYDDDDQNIVEFVQNLNTDQGKNGKDRKIKFKSAIDFRPSGEDVYH